MSPVACNKQFSDMVREIYKIFGVFVVLEAAHICNFFYKSSMF